MPSEWIHLNVNNPCSDHAVRATTNAPLALRALAMAALLSFAFPLHANGGKDDYRLLELDGYKVKWGDHSLGVGASISYAFADEPMTFDDARNCADLDPMETLSGPDLSFETWEREAAAAFSKWERAANLSFHQVDDPHNADIVIGAQANPVGRAFANVTYHPGSKDGVRVIDQALVCFNPQHQWKVGFDGDTDVYDIRYTLAHEIGHAIGLDHPGPEGQIMGFRYTEAFTGLQPGDRRGIRQLYGASAHDSELASTDPDTQAPETPEADDFIETIPSLSIE